MDDFNQLCHICFENFNKNFPQKTPKKLPCCKHTICLECLEDIYKRNNNKLICPVCRTILNEDPNYLITNNNVYEGFLKCLNCDKDVTKTELYLHFGEKLDLKCSHCQIEDLLLDDFLPSYLLELNSFIQEYSNKESLIQKIDNKINDFLNSFFQDIKNNIIYKMRLKVINEIKMKLDYDIKNDCEHFITHLNELKEKYDYLYSFANDDTNKKFNSEDIINYMNYYAQKSEDIRKESQKYLKTSNYINEHDLLYLNEKINKNEIGDFIVNLFDFPLSDIKDEDNFLTGIQIIDNNIIKQIKKITIKNQNHFDLKMNDFEHDKNLNNKNYNLNEMNGSDKNNSFNQNNNHKKKNSENSNYLNNFFNESDKKNNSDDSFNLNNLGKESDKKKNNDNSNYLNNSCNESDKNNSVDSYILNNMVKESDKKKNNYNSNYLNNSFNESDKKNNSDDSYNLNNYFNESDKKNNSDDSKSSNNSFKSLKKKKELNDEKKCNKKESDDKLNLIKKCNDQKDKIQKEEENFFDFDDTIFCAKKEKDKKKKHPRKRKIY